MTDPATTIREALESTPFQPRDPQKFRAALAALTELEQQLADGFVNTEWLGLTQKLEAAERERDELREKLTAESGYCGELLIERDQLADTLREIEQLALRDGSGVISLARAALDRQTP